MSLMATSTSNIAPLGRGGLESQQLTQHSGAGAMHGRAHRHFDGFQIQPPRLAAIVEDDAQQLV